MKHRVICILSLIFIFTSCSFSKELAANRIAHFRTRESKGLYYFMDNTVIKPKEGVLSIKNISNYKVLLSIYNKSNKDEVEYNALLEGGDIVSYYDLNKDNEYFIAVRIYSTDGAQDVDFIICTDYSNVPLEYFQKGYTVPQENRNLYDKVMDKLQDILNL